MRMFGIPSEGVADSPWRAPRWHVPAGRLPAALVEYDYCVPYFVPSYEVEYKTVNADIGAQQKFS